MAWRYLVHHKFTSAILVCSTACIIYLPVTVKLIVDQTAASLTSRAEATPLIVGAKGSPLQLALSTLYFETEPPESTDYSQWERIRDSGLATPIPVHARFLAGGKPVIGTNLDYFTFRGLRIAEGRQMGLLGECVVGAAAARDLGLNPGSSLITSTEGIFDIAGAYPLKLRVAGVLERNNSPDDGAVFVDIRTAWVIAGLIHGHEDLSDPKQAAQVLRKEGNVAVGNAAVVQFNEITPQNIDRYHVHGDMTSYPLTAVIAIPRDAKSGALLQGRFLGAEEMAQIIDPRNVIDDLLGTVVSVRKFVIVGLLVVGIATFALAVLVFLLSVRLRRQEIRTMHRIGGARSRIAGILAVEIVSTVILGLCLAAVLTYLSVQFGSTLIESLVFE